MSCFSVVVFSKIVVTKPFDRLWAGSFAGIIIRENTILSGIAIRPAALVNTTFQVTDTSKSVSLAIHVERNNNNNNTSGTDSNIVGEEGRQGQRQQIPNNTLRETVRNSNGLVMTSNEFTKQVFITFKPGKGVGGFIFISNYVMPNIHQYCQNKQGALHCYQVQYHKIF